MRAAAWWAPPVKARQSRRRRRELVLNSHLVSRAILLPKRRLVNDCGGAGEARPTFATIVSVELNGANLQERWADREGGRRRPSHAAKRAPTPGRMATSRTASIKHPAGQHDPTLVNNY